MSGYHVNKITKGVVGEWSKVIEEMQEVEDSQKQCNIIMELVELSDMYGAIELYVERKFGIQMGDLKKMSDVTRKVFEEGYRKERVSLYDYLISNYESIGYWGLGFVQVKVGRTNYHFYTDKFGVFDVDNPHTHKYDFSSSIITGELTDNRYTVKPSKIGYRRVSNKCTINQLEEEFVTCEIEDTLVHKKGDTYTLEAHVFHTVSATNGTITKLVKTTEDYNKQVASVLINEHNHKEINKVDVELLWNVVKKYGADIYEY